ncbi:MAG TPA: anti-phage protein KwaA [Methylophilaceae bacterium]|nr:anti-phage protein KwaA [Methylophilaceae bacterium]
MNNNGLWTKIELYIVSLWFLFFLLIVITLKVPIYFGDDWEFIGVKKLLLSNVIPLISIAFLIAGVFFYSRFRFLVRGSKKISAEISSLEDVNFEHLTFLTTYIIPLICFNLTDMRYLIALGILLIVIGIMYVKTDKFYANPTLAILGYRIYKISLKTRLGSVKDIIVITQDKIKVGDSIKYQELDEKVYYGGLV